MPLPTIADAIPFPIAPDSGFPVRLVRSWRTDILQPEGGAESRIALRTASVRRLEYTAVFGNAADGGRFRQLWYGATERLRFLVPLWCEKATVTAIVADQITADITDREGFDTAGFALLSLSDDVWEVVELDAITLAGVQTVDAVEGTYPPFATVLVPLMLAWLDPPTLDVKSADAEVCPLVFREELTGIVGIDPDAGGLVTPVAASVELERIQELGNPFGLTKYGAWHATVRDAAGIVIPNAPLTWDVTEIGAPDELSRTISNDDRDFGISFQAAAGQGYTIEATSGAASDSVTFVA